MAENIFLYMIANSNVYTFDQIYTEFRPRFIRYANYYVRDIAIAEDFTTEAFIIYWENKNKLSPHSNIPSYILTIIKNRCLNHLEHIKMKTRVINDLNELSSWELNSRIISLKACEPEKLFTDEIQKIVDETLTKLNKRTSLIFTLSRDKNLTNKEIADLLGITVKGVEFHISRALSELRKNLKDYFPLYLFIFCMP